MKKLILLTLILINVVNCAKVLKIQGFKEIIRRKAIKEKLSIAMVMKSYHSEPSQARKVGEEGRIYQGHYMKDNKNHFYEIKLSDEPPVNIISIKRIDRSEY